MKANTQMRIWHVVNFPRKAFKSTANSVEQAKAVLNALAEYDLFIGEDGKKNLGQRAKARTALNKKYKEHVSPELLNDYEEYLTSMNNGVPVVFSNAQGLEEFDEDEKEWLEWCDEESGYDISEVLRKEPFEFSLKEI